MRLAGLNMSLENPAAPMPPCAAGRSLVESWAKLAGRTSHKITCISNVAGWIMQQLPVGAGWAGAWGLVCLTVQGGVQLQPCRSHSSFRVGLNSS
jgi:hypothetical protein